MVVECTILSLISRERMKSCRGIGTFLCSCFVLLVWLFTRFDQATINFPSVLARYIDHTKSFMGIAWLIILVLFLVAELLPWVGVWLVSDLSNSSIQSFLGGAIDTLAQLIAFASIVCYMWVTFSLSVIGLGGESIAKYNSIFKMALIIVIFWFGVILLSKNIEKNERLYTKVGKDTSYCDVNGTIIRGYDKVSYYGFSFSVIPEGEKWILIPSMPGSRKYYALSDAAADIAGHLIKVKK